MRQASGETEMVESGETGCAIWGLFILVGDLGKAGRPLVYSAASKGSDSAPERTDWQERKGATDFHAYLFKEQNLDGWLLCFHSADERDEVVRLISREWLSGSVFVYCPQ